MKINNDLDNIHVGTSVPKNNESLWLFTSENLYSSKDESGSISTTDGMNAASSSRCRSEDMIVVQPNTQYTLNLSGNCQVVIFYYKNEATFLSYYNSASASSHTFTTPANCYYIRFRYENSSFLTSTKMLTQGNTARTRVSYVNPIVRAKSSYSNNYINLVDSNIYNSLAWKLLKRQHARATAISYPDGARELFLAIRTENSTDPMIPCYIPIIAKPSSGEFKYRIGYYFLDGVSGAVVVSMGPTSFYITDPYSGGAYKSSATVDIYYR